MTDDQLFGLANAVPLVGWFALLVPLARTTLVTTARVVAVVLSVGYAIGIAAALVAGDAKYQTSRLCWVSHMRSRRLA